MNDEDKRDRQMIELLNELRIALPGVQILFAFLLTVPFSNRFAKLTSFQRTDYYVTLLTTTLSTAFLIAPSAAHRLRFHKHDRNWLIESANIMSISGLVTLTVSMVGAVTLITDILYNGIVVWIFAILTALVLAGLWFARPLVRGHESSGP